MAIQLDHHAWRSQARDDKHEFISRSPGLWDEQSSWIATARSARLAMTTISQTAPGTFCFLILSGFYSGARKRRIKRARERSGERVFSPVVKWRGPIPHASFRMGPDG